MAKASMFHLYVSYSNPIHHTFEKLKTEASEVEPWIWL